MPVPQFDASITGIGIQQFHRHKPHNRQPLKQIACFLSRSDERRQVFADRYHCYNFKDDGSRP
jgi:hypothetical protein